MLEYKTKLPSGEVSVFIERKKIKNFYVKISPDSKVTVSMPFNMDVNKIYDFINANSKWLEKHIRKFQSADSDCVKDNICQGGIVQILDIRYAVFVLESSENKIIKDGFNLYIYSTNAGNLKHIEKQYEIYLKHEAGKYFKTITDQYYPLIEKFAISKPFLTVKKMKSKWGSCIPGQKKITLNLSLFKTSQLCVRYVVLHEMAHLIYSGHDKKFYDFLKQHMPDYRAVEKTLDYRMARLLY